MRYNRTTSIILVIVLIINLVIPVYGEEIELYSINGTMVSGDTVMGELWLHVDNGSNGGSSGGSGTGHVFLSYKNTYSVTTIVGVYHVAPGVEITIGTWPGVLHYGIYYNLESLLYYINGNLTNTVSLKTTITLSELVEINSIIAASNSYDLFSNNCMDFALRVWNAVATPQFSTGSSVSLPILLYNEMLDINGRVINRTIVENSMVAYITDSYTFHQLTVEEAALLAFTFNNVDDSEVMSMGEAQVED